MVLSPLLFKIVFQVTLDIYFVTIINNELFDNLIQVCLGSTYVILYTYCTAFLSALLALFTHTSFALLLENPTSEVVLL